MRKITILHIELNINKMSLFVNAFCNYFLQKHHKKGACSAEELLYKVYGLHLKRFPVQVRQISGLSCKTEGELVGIQRLIFTVEALVELAVFAVSEQGVAGVGKLGADLVRAAGDELALDERKSVFALERLIARGAGLRALLRQLRDVHAVFDRILEKITSERTFAWLRRAVDDAEVALVQLAVLDLLIQNPQRLGVFCRDDDATGVAVDAVAERRGKGVLFARPPFAFGI